MTHVCRYGNRLSLAIDFCFNDSLEMIIPNADILRPEQNVSICQTIEKSQIIAFFSFSLELSYLQKRSISICRFSHTYSLVTLIISLISSL